MIILAIRDIAPNDHMGPALSMFFVAILVVISVFTLVRALMEIRRWRTNGLLADRSFDPDARLTTGEAFVHGVVELDDDVDFAVVVEIRQIGAERKGSKGGYTHTWKEKSRRTFTNPFWIRHVSGERIRVEPTQDVDLVDRLDLTVQDESRTERFRIAELSAGESVIAKGTLTHESNPRTGIRGQGYRDAAPLVWVLRQRRGDARLHFTAEKLGDHHRRLAMTYIKRLAFGWLPATLVVSAICMPFVARVVAGEQDSVVIRSREHIPPRGKSSARWEVSFFDPGGETRTENLDFDDWTRVNIGDELAYVYVESLPTASALGLHSTLHVMAWIFSTIIALICMGLVLLSPMKPWYENKAWTEGGTGRLAEPQPSSRRVYSRE